MIFSRKNGNRNLFGDILTTYHLWGEEAVKIEKQATLLRLGNPFSRATEFMDAFSPTPPKWTENAIHSLNFLCPSCSSTASKSQGVWINRRAPVLGEDNRRKWQEFYQCHCGQVWWAWSSDRPPSEYARRDEEYE